MNEERVLQCLKDWVETFNDCCCCPLYPEQCELKDIDSLWCASGILELYLKGD